MELKKKKATRVVIAGACAAALAMGAALPAFAAGQDPAKGTTKVSYNTSTTIDTNVGWVVRIPSSLSFDLASAKTGVDVQVTLASKTSNPLKSLTDVPGYKAPVKPATDPTYGTVAVHMVSKNGMKLKLDGAASGQEDALDYSITTPDNVTINSATAGVTGSGDDFGLAGPTFCTFKQADANAADTEMSLKGKAFVNSTPTKDGDHQDVLTFGFNTKSPTTPSGGGGK